jgi:hypothetical protein
VIDSVLVNYIEESENGVKGIGGVLFLGVPGEEKRKIGSRKARCSCGKSKVH